MLNVQSLQAQTMLDVHMHVGPPYMDNISRNSEICISNNPRNSSCSRNSTCGDKEGNFFRWETSWSFPKEKEIEIKIDTFRIWTSISFRHSFFYKYSIVLSFGYTPNYSFSSIENP